ncbi:MAG: MFS transporter [Minisyncoccia bacterium]
MDKTKATILLTVFIDVIGLGVVIPILPFYVSTFSSSALVLTSLFAVFSLCSFFSAPIIGALSDKFGRRPLLILSIFSTAIGWFVFAWAPSILFLFIGRIIDGVMAGNFPIAQGFLSDIAKDDKERTANLGLIGAIFGIGFILGPFIGGALGKIGHTVPFWFVGLLALLNGIMAYFILPETHHELSNKKISINPFRPLYNAVKNTPLRLNFLAWFFFGLAISSYQSIFSLFMRDTYHFDEFAVGLVFGVTGVIIALNQGVAMKHIWLKYFKEPTLELGMLIIFAIGFFMLSLKIFTLFWIAILLTTFGQSILRVVMTSQVVGKSDRSERGEILGIMSSITSLSMMIGPFLAGILYGFSKSYPFVLGGLCLILAFVVLYQKRKELRNTALPEDVVMESLV